MIVKQLHMLFAALILLIASGSGQQIPAGTVLPVMLNSMLDSHRNQPGDKISARLMQDVSLASGERIPAGARVEGVVTQSSAPSASAPASFSLSFNRLVSEGRDWPIAVSLRALASMKSVFDAQLPWNTVNDFGSSVRDWNTVQVGGAAVYRGDGTVRDAMEVVGHTSMYGAVTARLQPNRRRGCPANASDNQAEQSL